MEEKKLQLGDQENAILLIQSSQTNPQKALAELVENSIDAKAKNIVITRRKRGGKIEIIVTDDGEGVKAGNDGDSDMDRIATSICDSLKKKLPEHLRENIQGEFAIGLLGFRAIGDNLEMVSRTDKSSKAMYLRLKADSLNYESGVSRRILTRRGTEVRVWPVRREMAPRLTAEKLSKYLGEELRERINRTHVKIVINDKIGKKEKVVHPQEYKGERITSAKNVTSPSGNIKLKLYIVQEGDEGKVSVFRRGTKVLDDITAIDELNHEPWSNPMLEGHIDSRFINVSPTTRRGVLPDKYLEEMMRALKSKEKDILEALKEASKKREKELSRDIIKVLRDAFSEVMGELPEEYEWFDVKGLGGIPGVIRRKTESGERKEHRPVRLARGPLDYITLTPKVSQVAPNERRKFIAKAWTEKGELIPIDVKYYWKHTPFNLGSMEPNKNECVFIAGSEEGEVKISVKATLEGKKAEAFVTVLILESKKPPKQQFPTPIAIDRPGENWRSRWNESVDTLEYNIGHPDCISAKKAKSKKMFIRYLGLLFAKHLVLHNFEKSGEDNVLERMIEVVGRLEKCI